MPYKKTATGTEWRPNNPKQEQFLSLSTKIKEGFFGGGAGGGKSEILLMYAVVNQWHNKPGFKQVFMRRTIPEITREIVPRSKLLFEPLGARYYKQEKYWQFPTEDQYGSDTMRDPKGGMIFFGHCEHEDNVHLYDGMEINLFTPDELTSFNEYIYLYIGFTRVRSANPELPAIIRASGMPGDIGHTFVYNRFVKPAPLGGKIIQGKGKNLRIYIFSTYKDNKDGDPTYGQSLEALPEQERRAKMGDWSTYEGSVFTELRTKHYPGEPENAVHVIKPFKIPPYWAKVIAIDWGFSAYCSIGFGAISPNKRLYVYRHDAFKGRKIEDWAAALKKDVEIEKPVAIVICHSANQNRGEPHTIYEQVAAALDYPQLKLGDKDRIGGKLLVHEYLRFTPLPLAPAESGVFDPQLAQWILRNKGVQEYSAYVNSFQPPEPEDNLPKLQFFDVPQMEMVTNALKAATYVKSDKDGKKKEDVSEFDGDDPYDMLRMLLSAVDEYVNTSKSEQQKVERQAEIEQRLEITGDMTAYYRNMRQMESEQRIQPVHLHPGSRHARNLRSR